MRSTPSGSDPRPLDLNPPAAQRDLTILVAVADRTTVRVPLPLRADHLVDLLLEQLPEHPQPDLDRQRQQPLLRCPHQLSQRLLDALGKHALITGRLGDRYGATHGGSSFGSWLIAPHAPTRSGRAGATAVTSKFHEHRDNLDHEASTSALPLYAFEQRSNHPPSRTTAGPLPGAD